MIAFKRWFFKTMFFKNDIAQFFFHHLLGPQALDLRNKAILRCKKIREFRTNGIFITDGNRLEAHCSTSKKKNNIYF